MRRVLSRLGGFTLIEMMITIALVAILATLAAPSFRTLVLNQRIKTASFDLYSAMTYVRSEAMKRNANVTLRAGATADGAWTTGWRVVDGANTLRSWGPVTNLSITEGNSLTTVTYGRDGRLPSGAVQPRMQISPNTSESGVTARCVQVDLSGRPITKMGACS